MPMYFSFEIVVTLLVACIDLLLGVIILLQDPRARLNTTYAFFALSVAAWGFGVGFFLALPTSSVPTEWFARFLYFAGGSIPATFLYFTTVFGAERKLPLWKTALIFLPTLIFIPLYFYTDLLIAGNGYTELSGKLFVYGPLHFLFDVHLWGYFIFAFFVLLHRFRNATTGQFKQHILFVMLGTYIVLAIAGITNVVAPLLSIFDLIWIGPTATILWVGVVAYAVMRHQLFNIRIITVELFVFSLWVLLLVRTFLSNNTRDLLINSISLTATVLLGFFLIRGVIYEVKAREEVERLAKDLEKANARLKELDRQKTEFVSIASHQLRSPLTAIKGYASLLLEGSYGKVSVAGVDAIKKIFDSSRYMAASIEDFLSVSRIELGTAKYDMKPIDAASMAKEVTEELIPAAKDKKLALAYKDRCDGKCSIVGDIGKLRQVVLNLIDNSIKYTQNGGITVTTEIDPVKRVARISITDTGVGIPTEVMPTLFKKFSRAKNANEVNVMGTGLGLFVAKQFVEAHKGRIWAESLGQGKGSSFIIELPLVS